MRAKLRMRRKTLVSALVVLFIVSIIPVLADESELDLTATVISDIAEVELTVTVLPSEPEPEPYRRPIRPNKIPVAEAGLNQTVYVGQFVKFSGVNSTDPDGTILSYEWDFGDGAEASGVNASHRYMMEDNYTVTLTVVDNRYGEDTDTCMITVIEEIIIPPPLPPYLDNLNITPEELELGDNVTISFNIMNFDSQHITYGVDIYVEDVNVTRIWIELGGYEFKTVSHTITPDTVGIYSVAVHGMTGSFTVEAPEIPLRPAEFVVSDLSITPEEVEEGKAITVSVDVTNIGETEGSYTVELVLDGFVVGSEEITPLGGGMTATVVFELTRGEGTYQVEVDGLTGSFTVKVPQKPAEFEATDLEITPEEVEEGEEVTITLKVSNIGEEEGTHTVELRIDGSLEESETVTLPGGGTEEVSFEVTRGEGSYQVEADGLTGEFTVTAPPGPPLTPGYISGIVILIVVAAVVIIYLFMERRGPFRLPSAGTAQS